MRRLLSIVPALLAFAVAAQDYPSKTVRIVVPFPAGGSTDVLARMVAQKLNESHGQLFIAENRPGATGTIGGAFVAKSPPDGYTLIMHSMSTYTAGYLYRKLSYDGATAFAPIINCSVNPFYLVSAASLPIRNVADLIALARRHPNELTFATVGTGSGAHLAAEMFNAAAGIKAVPVAYKGSAPAMIALASGETVYGDQQHSRRTTFRQAGKNARAGGDRGEAVAGRSRRADADRIRHPARSELVDGPVCAGRDAESDREQAQ